MHQNLVQIIHKFILYIYVFLEKLKSMIQQQHAYKTGLKMTCWFYEKGKKFGRLQMSPYSTLEFDPVLKTSH